MKDLATAFASANAFLTRRVRPVVFGSLTALAGCVAVPPDSNGPYAPASSYNYPAYEYRPLLIAPPPTIFIQPRYQYVPHRPHWDTRHPNHWNRGHHRH